MISRVFLIALGFRALSLLLPHTYFQPDEFYQAFEPASSLVFGKGHLTWEWADLPVVPGADGWWSEVVAAGRLRGWIWPGVFALVYSALQKLGLEDTEWLVFAPRLVGVVIAALTDYSTYRLANKVLGNGSAAGALFLSFTSLFHAHLLPRALSTSPETLLTTLALSFYPLATPYVPTKVVVGTQVPSPKDLKDVGGVQNIIHVDKSQSQDFTTADRVEDMNNWNKWSGSSSNLILAAALAALSICIRPTMAVFWAYLHLETTLTAYQKGGVDRVISFTLKTLLGGITTVAASTYLDHAIVGRLTLPFLTFVHRNVILNISSFYGATGLGYHLSQSLPILLFPLWYWWGKGFFASLLPAAFLPQFVATVPTTPALRTLARATAFTIGILSLSPHSEWRFVHPLLPQLLLFALPALQRSYMPGLAVATIPLLACLRQYCRLPRAAFYLLATAWIPPYIYLNTFHGAAQVSVINSLRNGEYGPVDAVVALMPCHSTPWASHLGNAWTEKSWFLTCVPPLAGVDPRGHWTQQDMFYESPVSYVEHVFPYPPVPLSQIGDLDNTPDMPSHVILFGEVLDRTEILGKEKRETSVRAALIEREYEEEAELWNGFDLLQDEEKRRGGVRVWVRRGALRDKNSW